MTTDHKLFYFAYGSNMDPERMAERKITFYHREAALLMDYRLVFNKLAKKDHSAYANILREEGHHVEGVLYTINADDIAKLDTVEGIPDHYLRKTIQVVTATGEAIEAETYMANPAMTREGLMPTREYLEHLLKAKDLLSAEYYAALLHTQTID